MPNYEQKTFIFQKNMNTRIILTLGIIAGIIIGYLIAKVYFFISIKKHRQDAVNRSRSVVLGNVNEKIAPLLPNFPYHYKDLVFLGKGVDYIVFDWLSKGDLQKIIFLEIKSGTSTLNRNEMMIKHCIQQWRVDYQIYKL